MAKVKRLQFKIEISAPVARVYDVMLGPDTYREWTTSFMPGSYYQGAWRQGENILFLGPSGEGMFAEIAECRPCEFISIRHLGMINSKGELDTTSDQVRDWVPAYENYTFVAIPGGTELVIDQDVTEQYEQHLKEGWNRGLKRLKELCESSD